MGSSPEGRRVNMTEVTAHTHAPRDLLSSPYNIVIGVATVNRNPLIVDSHHRYLINSKTNYRTEHGNYP